MDDRERPSLRQTLHNATGDREAEAAALADRAGDGVDEEDAETAVRRAHGDVHGGEPSDSDIASPDDARRAHEDEHR
jgi:hypothetical protein